MPSDGIWFQNCSRLEGAEKKTGVFGEGWKRGGRGGKNRNSKTEIRMMRAEISGVSGGGGGWRGVAGSKRKQGSGYWVLGACV